VPELVTPPEWRRAPRGPFSVWIAGFLAVLGAGLAVEAVYVAVGERNVQAAVVLAYGAVLLASILALWWFLRQARGARPQAPSPVMSTTDAGPGVTFAFAGRPKYLLASILALLVIGPVAMAVSGRREGDGAGGVLFTIILLVLALLLLWFLAVLLTGGSGRVVLTATGIHQHGVTVAQTVPWETVLDVVPTWVGGVPTIQLKAIPDARNRITPASPLIRRRARDDSPFMAVRTHWLAGDPTLLFHALGHYYQHPDHRSELGTNAGLERIIRGQATISLPPAGAAT
jgi:hypothetical protein